MKSKQAFFSILFGIVGVALVGCSAMTTLSRSKLQETASAIVGKKITSISNVRSVSDEQFFDAHASDGTTYACSLEVVFGVTSQGDKCVEKKQAHK